MIEYINDVADAPKAIGPYSQAVICNGMVFLSGQIPLDPATGQLAGSDIETQTEQVMKNLSAILKHLQLDFAAVAKTTILLSDLGHFKTVNGIYEKWLGKYRPARATFQVAGLPLGSLVEIEMVASLKA
ncbi:MAG: RidA family protein [Deltaproteobacteria bacterium]|nr:RidA family protein [Deltaproteobacteria bacterium]